MFKQVEIVIDQSMRGKCKAPYPNHPKGCPNYNKREDCPPKVPLIGKVFDLNHPVYAIWNIYDFKQHTDKMIGLHPEWSERQVECCLYWQGSARKQLKAEVSKFTIEHPDHLILKTPEACGVNITETMKNIGVELEWPPKTVTYQVALAGKAINSCIDNQKTEMPFFEMTDKKPKPKKSKKVLHNCRTCPLDRSTQTKLTGEGEKKILIFTEKPFPPLSQGNASWLIEHLRDNDIYYDDCWFISAAQCECKKEPTNKVINCCRRQWQRTVRSLKPEKIFLFGHTALKSFLGDRMKGIGKMEKWVGWAIPDQDYQSWVFPLFDIDFVRTHKNEAVEYVFQDHLVNAIEHNEPFKQHEETINVITDVKEAIDCLDNTLSIDPEWVSFDYEGTGLKPYRKEQELVSVSLAVDSNHGESMPIFDDDDFHDALSSILSNPDIKKTAHNIGFEQKWTRHVLGYEVEGLSFCSMVACHILDNRTGISGLKFQTYIRYGVADYDSEVNPFLTGLKEGENEKSGNRLNNIHLAPLDKLLYYGGDDSMFGYRLAMDQMKQLTEKGLDDVYDFFFDGLLALANVTENGMRIDEDYFNKTNIELETKLNDLQDKIYTSDEHQKWIKSGNEQIDILSSQQIKKLVLEVLKLKITKQTAKGSASVDKEVLKGLGEKHEFFNDIITYRETHKIKGTYVEGFLRESIDGVIHPNQNLHTTKTYRPSTTDPNFANVPKRDEEAQKLVRSGVVPRKGHLLLTVDYSGVEVASGCCYHKDPVMIDYVSKPENDMHHDQALRLFLLDPDQMTSPIRYVTKNGFIFPEFYGDYWRSCALAMWSAIDKLKTKDEIFVKDHLVGEGIRTLKHFEEHVKEEERIFWKEKFKVFDAWKQEAWEDYLSKGYIEYLTGFKCGGVLDRKNVVNYPFQGTGFHWLLWDIIKFDRILPSEGWDSQLCLQVYDEMMFDVHPDELNDLVPLIKDIMTVKIRKEFDWINVPLSVEIKTSEVDGNWFDMKELK